MRPNPSTMSDAHLLDEYLVVYRDAGRRRQAIRAELESRLSSSIVDAEADGKRIARLEAELDAARADLREAVALLRAYGQPHYWVGLKDAIDWNTRWGKLLAKHKETPDA